MRIFWYVLAALTMIGVGFGVGRSFESPDKRPPVRSDSRSEQKQKLLVGYYEISAEPDCSAGGTQTGLIRIRLSNLLGRLNDPRTVDRKIRFFSMTEKADEARVPDDTQSPSTSEPRRLTANETAGFFPTNLDFSTLIRSPEFNGRAVDADHYVVVRVVLDRRTNKEVEFLRSKLPGVALNDSSFAIMRSAATDKGMFFCRSPIQSEDTPTGKVDYVDFGIKSVGAKTGSFGIGLSVKDRIKPYVAPIILDPAVRNQG